MSWAHQWALWGLAALPVLVLLQLRQRRPVPRVSGAFQVWVRVRDASGDPPSRWRRWLRDLWRPLVIAGLLVAAAAGPRLSTGGRDRVCILLDTSPSARALLAGESSRWDAMTERAGTLLGELASDGEATLLVAPAGVYAGPPARAIEWLAELTPAAGAVDTTAAETILLERARAGVDCWLLADREPSLTPALTAAGVGIEIFAGESAGAGIVGFGVEELAGAVWAAGEIIVNGEADPHFELLVDGVGVPPRKLQAEGDRRRFQVQIGGELPAKVELRLQLAADGFAVDDVAIWRPPVLALVEDDAVPALRAAISAHGWKITDDVAQAEAYVGRGPLPPGMRGILLASGSGVEAFASAGVPELDAGAPAAVRTTLGAVRFPAMRVATVPRGVRTLVSVGGVPLVVLDEGAGVAQVNFALTEAPGLIHDPSGAFPILVSWLAATVVPGAGGTTGLLDAELSRRAAHGARSTIAGRPAPAGGGRVDLTWVAVVVAILVTLSRSRFRGGGGSAGGRS